MHGAKEAFTPPKLSSAESQNHAPCFFSFGDQLFLNGEFSQQLKFAKTIIKEHSFKDWFSNCNGKAFKENVLPKLEEQHGLDEQEIRAMTRQLNLCPHQKSTRHNLPAVVSPPPCKKPRMEQDQSPEE